MDESNPFGPVDLMPPPPVPVAFNEGEAAAVDGSEEDKNSAANMKKNKRKLTEQAKERHRVCNRLGARRARAQARLDMEVMKAQNALLYLELSMTRAALYSVGQREFCARVAFDIEQAKGTFS